MSYAELAAISNFSFLRGASHAEELVVRAAELGLSAIGIADRNTLAGVVRAHAAVKEVGIRLLVGVRLVTTDGFETIAYPTDRTAYGRLCRLLTRGNKRAKKGECHLSLDDVLDESEGQIFLVMPPSSLSDSSFQRTVKEIFRHRIDRGPPSCGEVEISRSEISGGGRATNGFPDQFRRLAEAARGRVYLAAAWHYSSGNARRLAALDVFARDHNVPMVAVNDVHYHVKERQILQDVLTCVREKTTIVEAGFLLTANAERHLKSPEEMTRLFVRYPDALARTAEIVRAVNFSLDELRYEYPDDCIGGADPQEALIRLTWEGAAKRYPDGIPQRIRAQLEHELTLIGSLHYAPYFLTVWDIVQFARSRNILCQGRGSAANSAICYVLGITGVNPDKLNLLFERFISSNRNEPPDIDVDFEHERREEVIQYVYEKYGRDRAGIAATVISYRSKSAIRDVGKALGLSLDVVGLLSGNLAGWGDGVDEENFAGTGIDLSDPTILQAICLARELYGFPRHLSQHVGGFVITRGKLEELIPIGNGAIDDRTFVEWDKDDLDALGILKVDVLALGMLTCIAKSFAMLKQHYGRELTLLSVPEDDPTVYDMLSLGDSVGVFQVESRAQMSMLPRLKPACFNDLVIEVAIVRPGPIQGDMVHPYLRRREGIEPVEFPTRELEEVLGMTLGVPLFQEQAMQIAIVAAGFTPSEADGLRRAMATFKRTGTIPMFREKFINGMVERGYQCDFAERCFRQIEGFAEYGFPMSHAAAFAHLVYVSSWLKKHYPEVFCAGLLNAQPMGFYAPAQLVRDAREHGVIVHPPDVNHSDWDHTLEPPENDGGCALRLGFRQIKGFRKGDAEKLMKARGTGYDGMRHLALASALPPAALVLLAEADAFRSLGLDRREALWAVKGLDGGRERARNPVPELPLFLRSDPEKLRGSDEVMLPPMRLGEHIVHDYVTLQLSLKAHPLALLRHRLAARGLTAHIRLIDLKDGDRVSVGGLVLVRQRPGTAKGIIFATLEDETGIANIVVWPAIFEKFRRTLLGARLLAVHGKLQRQGLVIHVVADRLDDLSSELGLLSADDAMDAPVARADEVRHGTSGDRRGNCAGDAGNRRYPNRAGLRRSIRDGAPALLLPPSRDFH
jgi:error-prone DNA polymerase